MPQQDVFAQYADKGDPFAQYADAPKSRTSSVLTGAKQGLGDIRDSALATAKLIAAAVQPGNVSAMTQVVQPFLEDPKGAAKSMFLPETGTGDKWQAGSRYTVGTLLPILAPMMPKMAKMAMRPKAASPIAKLAVTSGTGIPEAKAFSMPAQTARQTVSIKAPTPKAATAAVRPHVPPAAPPQLPASWQKLVDAKKPAAPAARAAKPIEVSPIADEPPFWSASKRQGSVKDLRAVVGADDAGDMLGIDADTIRDVTAGPHRTPLRVANRELDLDYLRQINNERGGIDPKLLLKGTVVGGGALAGAAAADDDSKLAGGVLGALAGLAAANPTRTLKIGQTARMTGMLSGMALPKSIAGNIGAVGTAALERGSMAPITEALRLPTNIKNAVSGFRHGANPAAIEGLGKINLPGRAMGALDEMTTKGLQRAGLPLEDAQRLLLTTPSPMGPGRLQDALHSGLGRFLVPFQRTPFNGVIEGIKSVQDLAPGSGASAMKRGLTVGAGAAGAVAGSAIDERDPQQLALLSLLAALAGPRAMPFAAGAGITAGPRVIQRVGVGLPDASLEDVVNPMRPIEQPAILRLLKMLQGQ